jgi:hypothetical protein
MICKTPCPEVTGFLPAQERQDEELAFTVIFLAESETGQWWFGWILRIVSVSEVKSTNCMSRRPGRRSGA